MKRFTPIIVACLVLAISCKKSDISSSTTSQNPETAAETPAALGSKNQSSPLRKCAADEVLLRQIAENPQRGRNLDALERVIQEKMTTAKGRPGSGGVTPERGLITIPVVVHVVMKTPSLVTDQQIKEQLDILNADFQSQNAELKPGVYLAGYDNTVANCQIAFTLQQKVIKETTVTSFSTNEAVKFSSQGGSNAINSTTALNVWVCDLSGGVLGYAQFPGGNAATDGVVIDYQAFGTHSPNYSLYAEFNKGRTATHEVGHWLNLRHIWGDSRCGDDLVGDTPQHDGPNFGNPSTNDMSSCKGKASLDMWMNYMDYSDDMSLYMFTKLQKSRMDLTLANARKNYY